MGLPMRHFVRITIYWPGLATANTESHRIGDRPPEPRLAAHRGGWAGYSRACESASAGTVCAADVHVEVQPRPSIIRAILAAILIRRYNLPSVGCSPTPPNRHRPGSANDFANAGAARCMARPHVDDPQWLSVANQFLRRSWSVSIANGSPTRSSATMTC
jgi:hypothetical protein